MEKFIPYEKLSKKKKREMDARKRTTWGPLNPVTRRSPDPRAYNRQKARRWKVDDHPDAPSVFLWTILSGALRAAPVCPKAPCPPSSRRR